MATCIIAIAREASIGASGPSVGLAVRIVFIAVTFQNVTVSALAVAAPVSAIPKTPTMECRNAELDSILRRKLLQQKIA